MKWSQHQVPKTALPQMTTCRWLHGYESILKCPTYSRYKHVLVSIANFLFMAATRFSSVHLRCTHTPRLFGLMGSQWRQDCQDGGGHLSCLWIYQRLCDYTFHVSWHDNDSSFSYFRESCDKFHKFCLIRRNVLKAALINIFYINTYSIRNNERVTRTYKPTVS